MSGMIELWLDEMTEMKARRNHEQSLADGLTRSTKRRLEPCGRDVVHPHGSRVPEPQPGGLAVGGGLPNGHHLQDGREALCLICMQEQCGLNLATHRLDERPSCRRAKVHIAFTLGTPDSIPGKAVEPEHYLYSLLAVILLPASIKSCRVNSERSDVVSL